MFSWFQAFAFKFNLYRYSVGAASVVAPLFIAEAAPSAHMRASLVSVEVLLITFGQLVAYLVNYLLVVHFGGGGSGAGESSMMSTLNNTNTTDGGAGGGANYSSNNGVWRWMLGLSGVPAVVQLLLLASGTVLESPLWWGLYKL